MYDANSDRNSVIVNRLIQPIEARLIRIYPESWYHHMSMRMELYGCEIQSGKEDCLRCNQILIENAGSVRLYFLSKLKFIKTHFTFASRPM